MVASVNWLLDWSGMRDARDQRLSLPSGGVSDSTVDEIMSGSIPQERYLNRNGYRLQTVAEKNYACRAGTTGARFFGENPQVVRFYAHCQKKGVANQCGALKPNDAGLFDMIGNIMEWTTDVVGEKRALCGGSSSWEGNEMRIDISSDALPGTAFNSIGFRVVRTLEPADADVTVSD